MPPIQNMLIYTALLSGVATQSVTASTGQVENNMFFQGFVAIVTLLISSGILIGLIKLIFVLGKQQQSFNDMKKSVDTLKPVVSKLNECVQEIQSVLKNKYRTLTLLQETISIYGISNSPIVLRDEYRDYIQQSGLANEIEEKKSKLVKWLKSKKPKTGLDAQEAILDYVFSDRIERELDTTEYKKQLYESGKSARDYYLILSIYMFEIIIPEVIKED